MGDLPCSLYVGGPFDNNTAAIIPHNESDLLALWAYCSSPEFKAEVRRIDQSLKVTTNTLEKIPVDIRYWREVGLVTFPDGLTARDSPEPTEWSCNGHIPTSNNPFNVAVARAPRVPLAAPDRLRVPGLPGPGSRTDWSPTRTRTASSAYRPSTKRAPPRCACAPCSPPPSARTGPAAPSEDLLAATGAKADQSWTSGCGTTSSSSTSSSSTTAPSSGTSGMAARTASTPWCTTTAWSTAAIQKLTYGYLSDWIAGRSRCESGHPAPPSAGWRRRARARAEELLEGEPPYDVFVRWKPPGPPIGWQPDINDGVRLNIRPFMPARDVGKKGAGILRAKPNIKWDKDRGPSPSATRPTTPGSGTRRSPPSPAPAAPTSPATAGTMST